MLTQISGLRTFIILVRACCKGKALLYRDCFVGTGDNTTRLYYIWFYVRKPRLRFHAKYCGCIETKPWSTLSVSLPLVHSHQRTLQHMCRARLRLAGEDRYCLAFVSMRQRGNIWKRRPDVTHVFGGINIVTCLVLCCANVIWCDELHRAI